MKRMLSAVLCLVLLCAGPAARAEEPETALWTRREGDGSYVTVRVPCPQGEKLGWAEVQNLYVRYKDTGEPVALTSQYFRGGWLFATLPSGQAGRELEAAQGAPKRFADHITVWEGYEYYDAPMGTGRLQLRGILRGDGSGNLNADSVITRAEAFAFLCRMLSLEPDGDPGYADVSPSDWYYETASAARAAGIAAEDVAFAPDRPVTRGEVTVMLYRALRTLGWVTAAPEGSDTLAWLADGADIPGWAEEAYRAFGVCRLGITERRPTGHQDNEGFPEEESLAVPAKGATRGEVIELIDSALRWMPVYPTQEAIDWGFDREMPVIDGSTSTYPYTRAVYGGLFGNYERHAQFPAAHSKSHESYERLIRGQVDLLFAATKASTELEAQAKAAGVELEYVPIAYDAMVFFTNEENSIAGLTQAQIQDIYVYGKYTNWNQVGGPDAELLPYRRNTDSGSHALMEHYFLEGGELALSPDVHNVYTSYAMSSALTDVAEALRMDPPAYAVGYSVYYYYVNGYWLLGDSTGGELKLLAVDGVVPSETTIADGSYPLAGYNYAVVRSDEPEASPARRMVEFMCSEAGQNCVENAGFGRLTGRTEP